MSTNKNISETNMIKYKHKNGNLLFKLGKDKYKRVLKNTGYPTKAFTKVVKANNKLKLPANYWKVYNRKTGRWIDTSFHGQLKGRYKKHYHVQGCHAVRSATSIEDWGKEAKDFYGTNSHSAFTMTCKSANVEGLEQHFNFSNRYHYENWHNRIIDYIGVNATSNVAVFRDANKGDRFSSDALINSTLEFCWLKGGCSREETIKTKEGAFQHFTILNPKSQRNNCGLECLRHAGVQMPSNTKVRRKFMINQDTLIDINSLIKIYAEYNKSDKHLLFIESNYNENYDKSFTYIMIDAGKHHYVLVTDIVRKKETTRHKRGVLAFDFETRKTEEYTMVGKTKSYYLKDTICKIAFRPLRAKNVETKVFITNDEKSSARQFLDWLHIQRTENKRYTCIAHNGARFDFFFLIRAFTRQELLHAPLLLRGTSVISMKYKEHNFKDTCCFMPNSLENLCKSFQITQPKLQEFVYNGKTLSNLELCFYKPELTFKEFMNLQKNEPVFWNLYDKYCESDVISLLELWQKFNTETITLVRRIAPFLLKVCTTGSATTIGGFAMSILRNLWKGDKYGLLKKYKTFMFKKGYDYKKADDDNVDREKYDFICNLKRGGISHCHQMGKHKEPVCSFDICSQYPAAQLNMIVPSGVSSWVTSYDNDQYGYYLLKNVAFHEKIKRGFRPIALKKGDDPLEWNIDFLSEVYMDSEMIKYLVKHNGMTFEVVKGLVSKNYVEGKHLFGKYVNSLFEAKKEQDMFKKQDKQAIKALTIQRWFRYGCKRRFYMHKHFLKLRSNIALREVIKLFLNSLTGKLVENYEKQFRVKYTPLTTKRGQNINDINYEKDKTAKDKVFNIWVNAGVMVYSYSKRILFEYIDLLPNRSDDVIHVETDSMYYPEKHKDYFKKQVASYCGEYSSCIGIGIEMGNVKLEHISQGTSYWLRKKMYYLDCKLDNEEVMAFKGVPRSTINKHGTKVVLVKREIYERLYKGERVPFQFSTMIKRLHGIQPISGHWQTKTISPYKDWKNDYKEYPLN